MFEDKYIKYVNKIKLQTGGSKKDKNYYLQKLLDIQKKIKEKGYVYWFDEEGKLLACDTYDTKAREKILKQIKKNKDDWAGKITVTIIISLDSKEIMDEETGGLELKIRVNKTIYNGSSISIPARDEEASLMKLYYKYDELKKFKLSDLKKIAIFMGQMKMKYIDPFKFYHYKDIKKYLE